MQKTTTKTTKMKMKKHFLQRNFRINWETLKRVTTKFSQRPSPSPNRSPSPRPSPSCSSSARDSVPNCSGLPPAPTHCPLLCRKFSKKITHTHTNIFVYNDMQLSRVESRRIAMSVVCRPSNYNNFLCIVVCSRARHTRTQIEGTENEKRKKVK